jgi:hypothetical protein
LVLLSVSLFRFFNKQAHFRLDIGRAKPEVYQLEGIKTFGSYSPLNTGSPLTVHYHLSHKSLMVVWNL